MSPKSRPKHKQPNKRPALLQSDAQTRAIVNMAVDAIITIDEHGLIDSVNPATERLFGWTAADLVGRNVSLLMPDPFKREHDGYLENYVRTGLAKIIGIGREVVGMKKDGSIFPMSLAVSELFIGKRRMFTGIVHDLSQRRQLERDVLLAATNEQRRIGHELHDGVCQTLAGLSMGLELLARKLRAKQLPEADHVRKLDDAVRSAADEIRKLAHGLNPIDIEAGGLPGALELLAARVSDAGTVDCRFQWDGHAHAPDANAATHLYRIAQEAIANAVKHGRPSQVDIHLTSGNGYLTLHVADNGSGIAEPESPLPAAAKKSLGGIGLHSMNYRARMIGGSFDIRPRTPAGTVVTCALRQVTPTKPAQA